MVGENDILVFLMFTIQVLLLFWGPKDFYVKNVVIMKDFIESSKSGYAFPIVPNFSKLKIKKSFLSTTAKPADENYECFFLLKIVPKCQEKYIVYSQK